MLRTILLVTVLFTAPVSWAKDLNWRLYSQLLQAYVKPGTRDGISTNLVDYAGLAADPMFPELVGQVRAFNPLQLDTDKDRLAFYINVYNILEMQVVLDHWPLKSMQDIGGVLQNGWTAIVLDNFDGQMSLDDIEHDRLMAPGDPRVHFAIHCAALGGPALRREPYQPSTLDSQLDDQVKNYLESNRAILVKGDKVHASDLFSRNLDDFGQQAGVATFIHRYRPGLDLSGLELDLPYNWGLNALHVPKTK